MFLKIISSNTLAASVNQRARLISQESEGFSPIVKVVCLTGLPDPSEPFSFLLRDYRIWFYGEDGNMILTGYRMNHGCSPTSYEKVELHLQPCVTRE